MAYPIRLSAGWDLTRIEGYSRSNNRRYSVVMVKTTSEVKDNAIQPADKGTGFLFWGWIVVTILNLGMVSVSLAIFAP
jgi:hypothetical protein